MHRKMNIDFIRDVKGKLVGEKGTLFFLRCGILFDRFLSDLLICWEDFLASDQNPDFGKTGKLLPRGHVNQNPNPTRRRGVEKPSTQKTTTTTNKNNPPPQREKNPHDTPPPHKVQRNHSQYKSCTNTTCTKKPL